MSHKEREIEKCNLCASSRWEKWGLPPSPGPAPPLPLFFSQNLKGPRGNWIDNGQFNWILFLFFHRRKGFLQDSLCLSRLYTATGVTDKKCSQCKSGRPVSASIHLLDHHFKMFSSETFDFPKKKLKIKSWTFLHLSILLPTDINSSKAL